MYMTVVSVSDACMSRLRVSRFHFAISRLSDGDDACALITLSSHTDIFDLRMNYGRLGIMQRLGGEKRRIKTQKTVFLAEGNLLCQGGGGRWKILSLLMRISIEDYNRRLVVRLGRVGF
jgi:hypothetical protein